MARRVPTHGWKEYRVGLLVVAGGILAMLGVLFVGSERGPFLPDKYPLYMELEDAAGIRVGSPVTVGGVAAGEVADLIMVPFEGTHPIGRQDPFVSPLIQEVDLLNIRLELHIREDYQSAITTASRAQLASLGVGGERYVKISPGAGAGRPLPSGATIEAVPSIDWDLVLTRLQRALNEAQALSEEGTALTARMATGGGTVGRLLDPAGPLRERIVRLQAEGAALALLLENGDGLIPRFGRDPALAGQIAGVQADLAAIEASLNDPRGSLSQWSDPDALRTAVAGLRTAVAELDAGLNGQGSLARFLNDPELYLDIRILQRKLSELTAAVVSNPLRFINIEVF